MGRAPHEEGCLHPPEMARSLRHELHRGSKQGKATKVRGVGEGRAARGLGCVPGIIQATTAPGPHHTVPLRSPPQRPQGPEQVGSLGSTQRPGLYNSRARVRFKHQNSRGQRAAHKHALLPVSWPVASLREERRVLPGKRTLECHHCSGDRS